MMTEDIFELEKASKVKRVLAILDSLLEYYDNDIEQAIAALHTILQDF